MFLSAASLGVEIVTAKSSEMNVVIPDGDDFVRLFLLSAAHPRNALVPPPPQKKGLILCGIHLSLLCVVQQK
jgi:hypothetical protein